MGEVVVEEVFVGLVLGGEELVEKEERVARVVVVVVVERWIEGVGVLVGEKGRDERRGNGFWKVGGSLGRKVLVKLRRLRIL